MTERPTPRTDAASKTAFPSDDTPDYDGYVYMRDFARQLERELAEAKEQRDRLVAFVESMVDALGPFPDINGTSVIPAAYAILREVKGQS